MFRSGDRPFFGITSASLSVIDRYLAHFVCGNELLDQFCELFVFTLCGFDYPNTNAVIRIQLTISSYIYPYRPDSLP